MSIEVLVVALLIVALLAFSAFLIIEDSRPCSIGLHDWGKWKHVGTTSHVYGFRPNETPYKYTRKLRKTCTNCGIEKTKKVAS